MTIFLFSWGAGVALVTLACMLRRFFAGYAYGCARIAVAGSQALGMDIVSLQEEMNIQRLRATRDARINRFCIRIAQEATVGRANHEYAKRCIAEALGIWIRTEFNTMENRLSRQRFVSDVARLVVWAGNEAGELKLHC